MVNFFERDSSKIILVKFTVIFMFHSYDFQTILINFFDNYLFFVFFKPFLHFQIYFFYFQIQEDQE